MGTFRKTVEAVEDTIEIWNFIAKHNPGAADALLEQIDDKLKILADAPRIGTKRDDLRKGMRSFSLGNFILFYNEVSDGIELIRVLHGARDLPSEFPS